MSNESIENAEADFDKHQIALVGNKEKSETTNIPKFQKKDIIDIISEDISQRRKEMFLRENVMLTVLTAYLAALFVVIGFVFKDNVLDVNYIKLIFLLIPVFLASGVAIIIHQQRLIYTLGAYIGVREEEINSILRGENGIESKDFLKYEKFIHEINSSRVILVIDGFLMLITFFPILALYLGSLNYIHKLDTGKWFYYDSVYIWYVTIFYILIFFIILFLFYYIGTRAYYEFVKKRFERNAD
jgi:hypothetical protein